MANSDITQNERKQHSESSPQRFRWGTWIKIVLVALIIILLNQVMDRLYFRWDLTENNQHSLSPATEKILEGLDDIVTIEAYFSADLPEKVQNVRNELRDMLEEFRARSQGNVRFEFITPGQEPGMKRKLRAKGIPEVELNVYEQDKTSVARVYMGLAISHEGKTKAVPVVNDIEGMEYKVISTINQLTQKKQPQVGYTTGHGEKDFGRKLRALSRLLRRQYDLVPVDLSKGEVGKGIKTLLVLGPSQAFSSKEIYYLDRFVLNGGNIFFALDQVELSQQRQRRGLMGQPVDTGLDKFVQHLGASVQQDLVLDRMCAKVSFPSRYGTVVRRYPFWPKLTDFNKDNLIVSYLDSLTLQWASSIEPISKDGVQSTVLARSSEQSWQKKQAFNLSPQVSPPNSDKMKPRAMAFLLQGRYSSFFSDKKIPEEVDESSKGPSKSPEVKHLVVGDSDFIIQGMRQGENGGNINFFLNGIGYLTTGGDLIAVRSKEVSDQPLQPTSDLFRSVVKTVTILFMPVMVILIGLLRYLKRRNVRRIYENMYSYSQS